MAPQTTFEVYSQHAGRWEIHSRFPGSQRDAAIQEAKTLEKQSAVTASKVVREVYDADEGTAEESIIYKRAALKEQLEKQRTERAASSSPAGRAAAPARKEKPAPAAARKAAPAAAKAKNKAKDDEAKPTGDDEKKEEAAKDEAKKDAAAKQEDEAKPKGVVLDADQVAESAAPKLSLKAEKQKVEMMRFLGKALEQIKTDKKSMDTFHKFGAALFLAGANESLCQANNIDVRSSSSILGDNVQVLGFSKTQAQKFADTCDSYLLDDSRYLQMYQAGRNAMSTFMDGDEEEGATGLKGPLAEWNKPKQKEEKSKLLTVMFTDMVGSTSLTQTKGDAVAQQVVRAHNRIVRSALSQYAGKEIKHTGDGIMASFSSAAESVEASLQIQRGTVAHNRANADLPLHLKIGLNAGEPIAEEDDLFGTTVQLAARIVDKAQSEQIYVSEIICGICAGKDMKFINAGGYEMKGVEEPVTLYEVAWEGSPGATAEPGDEAEEAAAEAEEAADEAEPRAAVPDPAAAEVAAAAAAAAQTVPQPAAVQAATPAAQAAVAAESKAS